MQLSPAVQPRGGTGANTQNDATSENNTRWGPAAARNLTHVYKIAMTSSSNLIIGVNLKLSIV